MLAPVITRASKSVNVSHQVADHEYSRQTLYDKLKGVETPVSSALLRVSTEKLIQTRKSTKMIHPDVITGFHTSIIDSKTYNATEHRLEETRTDARSLLPGRAIAMLDMRHQMFFDVVCDLNAHRCERKIAEKSFLSVSFCRVLCTLLTATSATVSCWITSFASSRTLSFVSAEFVPVGGTSRVKSRFCKVKTPRAKNV
jgi:hypothetical protein